MLCILEGFVKLLRPPPQAQLGLACLSAVAAAAPYKNANVILRGK